MVANKILITVRNSHRRESFFAYMRIFIAYENSITQLAG